MKGKKRSKGVNENTKAKDQSELIRKSKANIPAKYNSREERMTYLVKKIHRPAKNPDETKVERAFRVGCLLEALRGIMEEGSPESARIRFGALALHSELEDTDAYRCLLISRHVDPKRHPTLMKMPLMLLQELILAANGRKLGPFLREKGLNVTYCAKKRTSQRMFKIRLKEIIRGRSKRSFRSPSSGPIWELGAHQQTALEHLRHSLRILKRSRTSQFWGTIPKDQFGKILKTHRSIKTIRYKIGRQIKRIKDLLVV